MSMKLLIADDHPLMRAGIRTLLERTLDEPEIFEAVDGREALEIAATVRPDIVLMDISMPGLNGVDAARRFAAELPTCKVIMLSMHCHEERIAQCLRAGARGYLVKDAAVSEVVSAIDAVQRGEVFISQRAPAVVAKVLDREGADHQSTGALERAPARDSPADCRRAIDEGNRVSAASQWQDRRDAPSSADAAAGDPRRRRARAVRRSIGSRVPRALRPGLSGIA